MPSIKTAKEQLAEQIAEFYDDPLGYVMFVFPWDEDPSIQKVKLQEPWASRYGCEWGPDAWACEFLDHLGDEIKKRAFDGTSAVAPIRFTTSSGHGIGKSVMVAWLIKFILDTRPMSKGVVTANTGDQLKTKTWAELAKWHAMSVTADLFTYTNARGNMSIYRKGWGNPSNKKRIEENWRCDAMTCREENAEAFQGLHAAEGTPFYIFDEASGIPEKIWESRMGGATDGEPMSFDFGNPTRKSGYFYENCVGKNRHRFIVKKIDSRNVQITNKALIQEWAEDWGEDSDFFKVRVKGEFPSAGSVQFINSDDVDDAMRRPLPDDTRAPLLIGVDIARYGDDETVIYSRIGYDARSFGYKRFKGLDTTQVVEKVIETLQEFQRLGRKCNGLFVDEGYNPGVVDLLTRLGWNPIAVNFGNKASDRAYRYRGDEMWGRMRDDLRKLALPSDSLLREQLTQREYGFTDSGGKIHLESKRDMKDRGLVSPDIADALALTWASPPAMDVMDLAQTNPLFSNHEYDPLETR